MTAVKRKRNAIQKQKPENKGAIAQLGERLPCTQEVRGSIPRSSTIIIPNAVYLSELILQSKLTSLF